MILASLVDLYERRRHADDESQRLPEPGWQQGELHFALELSPDGTLTRVHDLRWPSTKGRLVGRPAIVPEEAPGRTVNPPPNLLWDKAEFVLGSVDPTLRAKNAKRALERATYRHGRFIERQKTLASVVGGDAGLDAVCAFLRSDPIGQVQRVVDDSLLNELTTLPVWLTFKLDHDFSFVFERSTVRAHVPAAVLALKGDREGQCLVTGMSTRIERSHPRVDGTAFKGAQSSGVRLVSFKAEAFESYGNKQGANAPVGVYAAFAYTTALDALLARDSGHNVRCGGTTVVFWAARASPNEGIVCDLLLDAADDDPGRGVVAVESLYKAPITGATPVTDDDTPFLILGLSAESKSRLTVRFFHSGTIKDAANDILRWRSELEIVGPSDAPPLRLRRLLAGLAVQGELSNAPPLLAAELLRVACTGKRFPQHVVAGAIARCAAERGPTRERAALIKAFLVRNLNRRIPVGLDPDETDPGYRLGRLFAVLERLQQAAVSPNATIRDRYWGAASTTPAFVFPSLLNLATSHLGKLEGGLGPWFERRIGEVVAGLSSALPSLLNLEQQGRFAIGYWHERFAPRPEKIAAATALAPAESNGEAQ